MAQIIFPSRSFATYAVVTGLVVNYGYERALQLLEGNIEVAKEKLTSYFKAHDQDITQEQANYLANFSMEVLQTAGQVAVHQVAAKRFHAGKKGPGKAGKAAKISKKAGKAAKVEGAAKAQKVGKVGKQGKVEGGGKVANSNAGATSSIQITKARFGHSFAKHGEDSTTYLIHRAKSSGVAQGQFLNNQKAAHFILDNTNKMANGAVNVLISSNFPARVIMPDGTFKIATHICIVPSSKGVKTAYPMILSP